MRTVAVLAALFAVVFPGLALAQQQTVVVLLPDQFQLEERVALQLRENLIEAVEQHPDYQVMELPPQTLSDLQLAIGCSLELDLCLELIGELLEADNIIWGDIGGTERAYLVELTFWDFNTASERYQFSNAFEGDLDTFRELLPVMARGVVYGPVGEITLEVDPPDAQVQFDARPVTRRVLSGLELGPHRLVATAPEYFDHRETIVVDVEPETVEIELQPHTEIVEVSESRLWTWVALGTGVALTGTGVAFGLLTKDTQDEYDSLAGRAQLDLERLQELQDEGERNALLTNILIGTGVAAIAAGVVLFFVEGGGETPVEGEATTVTPNFGFGLDGESYGISLDIEF